MYNNLLLPQEYIFPKHLQPDFEQPQPDSARVQSYTVKP